MKIYSNEKLIKRNKKLSNIFTFGSLIILGAGFYLSFKLANNTLKIILTYGFLIIGFLMFQIGNYFLNRWGRSPRPDELLSASLKGLDDKYSLFHYTTPISHLLVGPAGVIALLPYLQNGMIKYDKKKKDWKQTGGNWFLKVFGQEGLGRPLNDSKYAKEDLERFMKSIDVSSDTVNVSTLLVFMNEKSEIQGEGSPVAYTTGSKLKDYIRKKGKENTTNTDLVFSALSKKV